MKDQILVVTQMNDPHADEGIAAMQRLGHEPIRLNSDEIPDEVIFDLDLALSDRIGRLFITSSGRSVELSEIRSVWWRRPAHYGLGSDLSLQEKIFASREVDHVLRGLWASLDCYWMSEPDLIRAASWKGEQLRRAQRSGFKVPRSMITNDPDRARSFLERCGGEMVFKVLSDSFLGQEEVAVQYPAQPLESVEVPTTLIDQKNSDLLEEVAGVPCLFQQYIPKRVEYRVTVIGASVFTAEIQSQEDDRTRIDWRHSDVDIPYARADLPPGVEAQCLDFVKSYGLNFSALDLISTPTGEIVFLENNPNGQFLFVEDLVPELPLIDTVAKCLISGTSV